MDGLLRRQYFGDQSLDGGGEGGDCSTVHTVVLSLFSLWYTSHAAGDALGKLSRR